MQKQRLVWIDMHTKKLYLLSIVTCLWILLTRSNIIWRTSKMDTYFFKSFK